jgi:V/A-type H+-transporting ATPase subunit E
MNESIQELTNKIYQQGVEKAEVRAKEMIDDASRKARELVTEAESRAREIVDNAERKASELKIKNEAEMRLSARQAMGALKQRITEMVNVQLNHESVHNAVSDTSFMQSLISKLMDYWLAKVGQEQRLGILLPQDEYQAYSKYLEEKTGELMKSGISIEFSGNLKNGFQIVAIDQGFKVSFTDEDFEHYFSTFARPRIHKLLFGQDD